MHCLYRTVASNLCRPQALRLFGVFGQISRLYSIRVMSRANGGSSASGSAVIPLHSFDTSSCREKDVLGMHRIEHRSSAAGLVGIKSQISELRTSLDGHSNSKEDNPEGASSGSFSKHRYFRKRKTKIDLRSSEHDNLLGEESRNFFPSQFGKKTMPYPIKRSKSRQRNSKGSLKVKPFDICLFDRRNSGVLNDNDSECTFEDTRQAILRPGMVLLKHYISHDHQVEIVKTCRELGLGPGGFYRPGYQGGAKLCLQMMCLGLDWDPEARKYGDRRQADGCVPPGIPCEFDILIRRAIQAAHAVIKQKMELSNVEEMLPSMSPNIGIVNFYTTSGRLGLHQDRDESPESLGKGLHVVSFSVGDSAEFLYGDHRNVDSAEKVILESGDVLIFGGKSRHIFHGVTSIIPNSAPKSLLEEVKLRPGRLNLTFRQF